MIRSLKYKRKRGVESTEIPTITSATTSIPVIQPIAHDVPLEARHQRLFVNETNGNHRWHKIGLYADQFTKPNRVGKNHTLAKPGARTAVTNRILLKALEEMCLHVTSDFFYSIFPLHSLSRQMLEASRVEIQYETPHEPIMIRLYKGPKNRPEEQRLTQVMLISPLTTKPILHPTPLSIESQVKTS